MTDPADPPDPAVARPDPGPSRRRILRGAGLAAAGAIAGAGAGYGFQQFEIDTVITTAGNAVGRYRPRGLTVTETVYRVPTSERAVALTFDDGPSRRYTAAILDILAAADVRATFFQVGRHVHDLPELAARVAATHEIGNHTWSHFNLGLADAPTATRQLRRTADQISKTTGVAARLFRPPFGAYSGATAMVAAGMAYPMILWDFNFQMHGVSAAANVTRMVAMARPGSIILGHDGGTLNCDVVVAALPELIKRLQEEGYRLVTVGELLTLPRTNAQPIG